MPVNIFTNLPVNIFVLPVNCPKKLAREPKKVPVNTKKVSVNLKSAREHFHKNCRIWAFTGTFYAFTDTFFLLIPKNCPWTAKCTREHFKILCPWTTEKCPWKRPKKCPWTQPLTREPSEKSAREDLPKNEVHGHFWGSRQKKTLGTPTVATWYCANLTVSRIGNMSKIFAFILCRFPPLYMDVKFWADFKKNK